MMEILMLVGAMFLAGSSVVVGKVLATAVPVSIATFGSLLVAFICMLPLMWKRFGEVRNLTGRQWLYLFLQGLCGIVLFRVFLLIGLQSTGAVQAGIITGTTPAVLAILSFWLLGERLSWRALLSISCSVGGAILILTAAASGASTAATAAGGLCVMAAVVCEALFTIFRKQVAHTVPAITNTAVLIFCSLLLVMIPALVQAGDLARILTVRTALAIIYYGMFATVLAYLLWTGAVGKVHGAIAGAATAMMPASSVLLGAIVLKEKLLPSHLAGLVLIVIGIIGAALATRSAPAVIPAADRKNK